MTARHAIYCVATLILAAHPCTANEDREKGSEPAWAEIRQTLAASKDKLMASQAALERDLANMQSDRELVESDLEKFNAENAALDSLLKQLESTRSNMRRRLTELYRTNLKLRQKLAPKP